MRNAKRIFVFMVGLLVFVSGCTNQQGYSTKDDIIKSNSSSNSSGIEDETDDRQIFSEKIKIYKISRDVLYSFLENPSLNTIKNNNLSEYLYPEMGDWYVTENVVRFPIKKQMIEFLGNKTEIKKYLYQNSVSGEIKNMAIIDVSKVPLTMWIKTTEANVYITINENPEDIEYIYRLYTQYDFNEKYMCKSGKLIVEGEEIKTENSPRIYYDYADVPLTVVLETLGAKVDRRSETNTVISFNDKTYRLNIADCTLYKRTFFYTDKTVNMLYKVDGGAIFVYSVGKELMVDSSTLNSILSDMGQKITVKIDAENKTVSINKRG